MCNAGSGELYDFKNQAPSYNKYYGSIMLGKYASARDLGNFAAGIIKANSFIGANLVQWGYGTYNITKNKWDIIGVMCYDWLLLNSNDYKARKRGLNSFINHSFSEDTFSQHGIDAGYNFWNNRK